MSRVPKKRLILYVRLAVTLLIVLLTSYLSEEESYEAIAAEEAVLYSNVCHDNFEKIYTEAVLGAHDSILLVIYSLSDSKLIHALNAQAAKGVAVKVLYDSTTPPHGFRKLSADVSKNPIKLSGLMHQKILVVDHEKIWLGSANMTAESLKMHDNLVVGFINPHIAHAIEEEKPYCKTLQGDGNIEFWSFPQKGKEGLNRLIGLIDAAERTVRVAMFTWTHNSLTEAIMRAHKRGVKVEIILDQGQANGVCRRTCQTLLESGIPYHLNSGSPLLHHKFAWIDEHFLINGSANWTVSAFTRNRDCFLILYPLTPAQNEKLHTLWKRTWSSTFPPLALFARWEIRAQLSSLV